VAQQHLSKVFGNLYHIVVGPHYWLTSALADVWGRTSWAFVSCWSKFPIPSFYLECELTSTEFFFDRVCWPAPRVALHNHGVSDHLVRPLGKLYSNQTGQIFGQSDGKDMLSISIHAGVHHRCVLNPRICCAALQQGMRQWRKPKTLEQKEIDSRADMPHLLGLNFCWWHTSVCECAKNVSIHRRLCNFHAIVTLLPLSECSCGLSSMMQY